MARWTRRPQEKIGSYFFSGQFYATKKVATELSADEILYIYNDAKAYAVNNRGIDYMQVYTDEKGRTLFFIDQLNKEMIDSDEYQDEDNHCTLLFASEY